MGLGGMYCEAERRAQRQGEEREQQGAASAWVVKGPGTAKGAVNPFSRAVGQGNGSRSPADAPQATGFSLLLQQQQQQQRPKQPPPPRMPQATVSSQSPASDRNDEAPEPSLSAVAEQQSIGSDEDDVPASLSASPDADVSQGRGGGVCYPGFLAQSPLDLLLPTDTHATLGPRSEDDDTVRGKDVAGDLTVMEALMEESGPRGVPRQPVSVMEALTHDRIPGSSQGQVGRRSHD